MQANIKNNSTDCRASTTQWLEHNLRTHESFCHTTKRCSSPCRTKNYFSSKFGFVSWEKFNDSNRMLIIYAYMNSSGISLPRNSSGMLSSSNGNELNPNVLFKKSLKDVAFGTTTKLVTMIT